AACAGLRDVAAPIRSGEAQCSPRNRNIWALSVIDDCAHGGATAADRTSEDAVVAHNARRGQTLRRRSAFPIPVARPLSPARPRPVFPLRPMAISDNLCAFTIR